MRKTENVGRVRRLNPSPNAANLWMARAYAGTVMLEGATLSEGRGTTRPLELFGAPDIDAKAVIAEMQRLAPHWLKGCRLRECFFEPTCRKNSREFTGRSVLRLLSSGSTFRNR